MVNATQQLRKLNVYSHSMVLSQSVNIANILRCLTNNILQVLSCSLSLLLTFWQFLCIQILITYDLGSMCINNPDVKIEDG